MLARLVISGDLSDAREVARKLYRAARQSGLEADEGEATIRSAFRSRGIAL